MQRWQSSNGPILDNGLSLAIMTCTVAETYKSMPKLRHFINSKALRHSSAGYICWPHSPLTYSDTTLNWIVIIAFDCEVFSWPYFGVFVWLFAIHISVTTTLLAILQTRNSLHCRSRYYTNNRRIWGLMSSLTPLQSPQMEVIKKQHIVESQASGWRNFEIGSVTACLFQLVFDIQQGTTALLWCLFNGSPDAEDAHQITEVKDIILSS